MAKVKIYELAKELGVESKEVIEFLGKKNIEVKSHSSAIEENEAQLVKQESQKVKRQKRRPRRKISYMYSVRRTPRTAESRVEDREDVRRPEPVRPCRGNRCRSITAARQRRQRPVRQKPHLQK